MASIEVNAVSISCGRCGKPYPKRKGYFYANHSESYKGIGYIAICRSCVDKIFDMYMEQCGDMRMALRQVCRKLDLYWSDSIFDFVEKKNTSYSILQAYLQKLNTMTYIGKCYDDTLIEEDSLWSFGKTEIADDSSNDNHSDDKDPPVVTPEMVKFWGQGLSEDDYIALEQRKNQRISDLAKEKGLDPSSFDLGTMEIIKQLAYIDIEIINNTRYAGSKGSNTPALVKTAVELMSQIDIKPAQKQEDVDTATADTPLGVWLYRYEMKRPLPEVDDDLKDINGIKKYIFTWMGHLTKMLGINSGYTKLYESEVARLRVEKPEYDDEDDETLLSDYYTDNEVGYEVGDDL